MDGTKVEEEKHGAKGEEEKHGAGAVTEPGSEAGSGSGSGSSDDYGPFSDDSCNGLFRQYPSIGALRNAVATLRKTAAIRSVPIPTLTFTGTVKLHGANAGIGWDAKTGRMWTQSRRHVLGAKDLVGFRAHVTKHKATFKAMLMDVLADEDTAVVVFGEWVGRGVQKGVAMSQVDPMFVAFAVRHARRGDDSKWGPRDEVACIGPNTEARLHNTYEFGEYTAVVDFNNPGLAQAELERITNDVERECPVGRAFGVSGVGEGVVWMSDAHEHFAAGTVMFKVKGEKHAGVKGPKQKKGAIAAIDPAQLAGVREFVDYAVTEARCEQGWDEVVVKEGLEPSTEHMRAFLQWMMRDVMKEEGDTAAANGLPNKLVRKEVVNKARAWFGAKVTKEAGLGGSEAAE